MKSDTETEYFELLDQAIAAPASRAVSEKNLLAQILRLNRVTFAIPEIDPDRLYRELIFGRSRGRTNSIADYFVIIARPGETPQNLPREGDILLRVIPGHPGLGHVAVINDSTLWSHEELSHAPFAAERQQPGYYAVVSEAGACPHPRSQPFARRILDKLKRMLPSQILLRLRPTEDMAERIAASTWLDERTMLPNLVESFQGKFPLTGWTTYVPLTGWTTCIPFELSGKPHFLAYDSSSGDVSINHIKPGGRDIETLWGTPVTATIKWATGWTHFIPFKIGGKPHYLAYKGATGEVRIDRIKSDGKGVDTIWGTPLDPSLKWVTDWTHFIPFTLNAKPYYLAYQSNTGEMRIDRVKADGKGVDTIWTEPLPQGRTTGVTYMLFELLGKPHFLYYNGSRGNVSICRIEPDGKGYVVIWGTPFNHSLQWALGWTHFMPFTLNARPHYLAYKAGTGEYRIDRIKADGKGVDKTISGTPINPNLKWAPDWTTIMPFEMNNKPYYLAHSKTSRWVEIRSMVEELSRCVSPGVGQIDPTALNLSPVGTDDFKVTLTIRGASYDVKGNVFYPGKRNGAKVPFNSAAVAGGKAPIVFIAHGNHAIFRNPAIKEHESGTDPGGFVPIANHRGYEYLQRLLAQMGMISVSVDCNQFSGFQFLTKANIDGRTDLVLGAIKHFQSLDYGADPTFGSHIDFSSVGLMGHSRGGEVMLRVPELLAVPSTGIKNVKVKGVLSIAPTDIRATSGRPTGFAFMTILPAADLDVVRNDGAKFYDQASTNPFKCQLYIHDANHNFFNTEWVSDDPTEWDPVTGLMINPRIGITVMDKDDQKAILRAYGCAFFRTVLAGHGRRLAGQQMIKFMEGLEIPPGVVRFRDVHISFERSASTTVDDNEDRDIHDNILGKKLNSWSGGLSADEIEFTKTPTNTFFGNTRGMVTQSSTASGKFRWGLSGTVDLTGKEIRVRAAEVYNGTYVPAEATGFKLGLEDNLGRMGFVDSDDVGGLPRPYERRYDDSAHHISSHTKTMLKTLRFPVSCISRAEPGFKATNVRAIFVQMDRKDGRKLAFDQLQIV